LQTEVFVRLINGNLNRKKKRLKKIGDGKFGLWGKASKVIEKKISQLWKLWGLYDFS